MAKIWSNSVRFFAFGFDVGTATTSSGVTIAVAPLDVTAYGDGGERQIGGIRQDAFEWGGIFDDSGASDAAGSAMLGSGTNNVIQLHLGTGVGAYGYAGTALMVSNKHAASKSELVMAEAEYRVDGKMYRGQILIGSRTTFTGSGSSGTADGTTSSTGTTAFFLQVFSSSGVGSGTVVLQSAATATGVYTAFITIAGISAVGGYIGKATGSLDRFTRVIKVATGTLDLAAMFARTI